MSLNPVGGYRIAIPATHSPVEPSEGRSGAILPCILCSIHDADPDRWFGPAHARELWGHGWDTWMAVVHNLERRDGRWVPRPMEPTWTPCPGPCMDLDWVEWVEAD